MLVIVVAFMPYIFLTGNDPVIQEDALGIMGGGVQMPLMGEAQSIFAVGLGLIGYGLIVTAITFFPGMVGMFMLEDERIDVINEKRNEQFWEMVQNHQNYTKREVIDVFENWSHGPLNGFRARRRLTNEMYKMYEEEVKKLH